MPEFFLSVRHLNDNRTMTVWRVLQQSNDLDRLMHNAEVITAVPVKITVVPTDKLKLQNVFARNIEGEENKLTLPAGASHTLGESMVIEAPARWHSRLVALWPHLCYGPKYSRAVINNIEAMSASVRDGYSAVAYSRLIVAEMAAGIDPEDGDGPEANSHFGGEPSTDLGRGAE